MCSYLIVCFSVSVQNCVLKQIINAFAYLNEFEDDEFYSGFTGYPPDHQVTRQISEAANREKLRRTLFSNLRLCARECLNFDIPLTLAVLADVTEHMTKLIGGVVPLVDLRPDDRIYPEAPSNDFRDVKLIVAEVVDGPIDVVENDIVVFPIPQ